jgi:hypothetical protein
VAEEEFEQYSKALNGLRDFRDLVAPWRFFEERKYEFMPAASLVPREEVYKFLAPECDV